MIKKGLIKGCAALVLLLALVSAAILPASATEGESIDLSRPASAHNVTVTSADIVEYFLGSPVTDEEREYLERHGGVSLKFDVGITTSYVISEYESGRLTVTAREYSYTAADGTAVTWIPVLLAARDATASFASSDGGFVATLDNIPEEEGLCATVDYELDIAISTDTVNRLLNLAYDDIPAVRAELEEGYAEYDRLKAEYDAGVLAHEEYLAKMAQYELDYAAYTDYLSKKKIYDDAKAEYDDYVEHLAEYKAALEAEKEYEAALAEYNSALSAYTEYVAALDVYNVRLAEYKEYLAKIQLVRDQLAALDAFWVPMTDGRTAHGAINGNLVTEVLEGNRDLFEGNTFKVDACLIDDAGAATRNLRTLMSDYKAQSGEIAKYQFYINHYESFRDNTVLLLQSLDELYNYDKVRAGINMRDTSYPRKYEILVAQLAIIANALNDGPVYSYWAVYHDSKCTSDCTLSAHKSNRYAINGDTLIHKKSVSEMLEGKTYLTDTESATPLSDGVPVEVAEPTAPTVVDRPVKPTAPTVPAEPSEVKDPGDPPPVVDEPELPEEAGVPDEPTEYIPPAEKTAILDLYDEGRLERREELTGGCVYTATASIQKKLFNVDTVTVFFYSEGGELLYATEVDSGTRADFIGEIPTKTEDAAATYTFSHWADADGIAASLSAVESDLALYPAFTALTKSYDVTFNVDGEKTVFSLPYGATPVFGGVPTRPDDEYFEYTFSGWDSEPSAVIGEAEYTATFSSEYILPLTNGGARITDNGTYLVAECADPFTSSFDLSGVIARATAIGNARGLVLDTRVFDVTLSYQTLLEMREAGDTTLRLSRTRSGDYTYYYSAYVGDGVYRISAIVPCNFASGRQLRLYYTGEDGGKSAVLYGYEDGTVSFTMYTGREYTLAEEYELGVIENSLVTVGLVGGTVARGKRVTVNVDVPLGVSLDRVYLVFPDGSEQDVTDGELVMPDSDVTLCIAASYIEYRISFVSADKTIVVYKHRYGDTVIPPPDPSRPSDGEYRYYFVDWSEKIDTVTADKTYYALYDAVPLPPVKDPDGLQISDTVLGLIVAGGAFIVMMTLAVIPSGVCAIVLARRERRLYVRKTRRKEKNSDRNE